MRPWILAETNYGHVKQCRYDVALLPMGATEPHNLHLPYGTDTLEGTLIGEKSCEAAWNRGAKVVLLPAIPYGTETNQREFPLSMNVNPTTLGLVIRDLMASLALSGVRKLLLLNSHGGNDFKPLLRELFGEQTGPESVKVFLCDWYRSISADVQSEVIEHAEDHAGEMETSMLLAYFPDLVATDEKGALIADEGAVRQTRFDAVNRGWVSITRPWHLLTTNSGSGNPHAATAEKGQKIVEAIVDRLADFLFDLAAAEIDETFPF